MASSRPFVGARGRIASVALLLLGIAVPAADALAHGGMYRGPNPAVPGAPTPARPGGPGSPMTGGGPSISDEVSWYQWWEFNKDEFLQISTARDKHALTGEDDFHLGFGSRRRPVDMLRPTDTDLRDRILPALLALLEREPNRDVQGATAIAIAKLAPSVPAFVVEPVLSPLIRRDDQEIRESGVVALGIAGRATSLPLLLGLLRDDGVGRKLSDKSSVSDRSRAFAAYGLGLLARRCNDPAITEQVRDALWAALTSKGEVQRDVLAAAVNGLGVMVADPAASAHKRLAWQTVEMLLEWYRRDLGRGDEAIQAQAPVAIGRLLGRGNSHIHQRCKEEFASEFTRRARRSNPILQSSALALGMLCLPGEQHAADQSFSDALRTFYSRGNDRLARYLAAIALARIGGASNREWLLDGFNRTSRMPEQPWFAIGVGLCANQALRRGEPDETAARLLAAEMPRATKPEGQSAIAVAIGLTGCRTSAPLLTRWLRDCEHDELQAGYHCVGLALLGDAATAPALIAIMERSRRRPFLFLQAAIGLGRVGDREATERLIAMLDASQSAVVLGSIANAIGQIGDRRAIAPLVTKTRDGELSRLARAFVAAALGGIGDREPLPWNVPFSRDSNYGAAVDTLTNGATGILDLL